METRNETGQSPPAVAVGDSDRRRAGVRHPHRDCNAAFVWYLRAALALIAFLYIAGQSAAYLWSSSDQGS